ncbi:MAG: hypothetical protein AB7S26_04425 [Sandaracinaceae bacterium]
MKQPERTYRTPLIADRVERPNGATEVVRTMGALGMLGGAALIEVGATSAPESGSWFAIGLVACGVSFLALRFPELFWVARRRAPDAPARVVEPIGTPSDA